MSSFSRCVVADECRLFNRFLFMLRDFRYTPWKRIYIHVDKVANLDVLLRLPPSHLGGKFIGCKSLEWFSLKEFYFHARYSFQNMLVRCEFFPVFALMPQSTCNDIRVIMTLSNLRYCCWPLSAPLPQPLLADWSLPGFEWLTLGLGAASP